MLHLPFPCLPTSHYLSPGLSASFTFTRWENKITHQASVSRYLSSLQFQSSGEDPTKKKNRPASSYISKIDVLEIQHIELSCWRGALCVCSSTHCPSGCDIYQHIGQSNSLFAPVTYSWFTVAILPCVCLAVEAEIIKFSSVQLVHHCYDDTVVPYIASAEGDRMNYPHCRTMAINYIQIIYILCHSFCIVGHFPSFQPLIKFPSKSWSLFLQHKTWYDELVD